MNTIFSFILVLGLLIFVHEFGHFLFAKLFGVRVLTFSLGFGPKLIGKVIGETEYVISAVPLGGYVKMFGENIEEQDVPEEEKTVSFAHKTVWQRFGIVLAGPVFNFLFAVFLFFCLFMVQGIPEAVDGTRVGQVTENSAAMVAGMKAGDVIRAIDGRETLSWDDVLEGVQQSGGNPLSIVVLREGKELSLEVTPQFEAVTNMLGEKEEPRYLIGIIRDAEVRYIDAGVWQTLESAAVKTWSLIDLTVLIVKKLIAGKIPASQLGGPILIAQAAGQQMAAGFDDFLYFMAFLSVNLGVLNLLPVPVLDGGHLMFLTLEAIRRKPLDEKAQIVAQQIGLALLATLMIFVFYNDILRIFKG